MPSCSVYGGDHLLYSLGTDEAQLLPICYYLEIIEEAESGWGTEESAFQLVAFVTLIRMVCGQRRSVESVFCLPFLQHIPISRAEPRAVPLPGLVEYWGLPARPQQPAVSLPALHAAGP